MVSQILWAGTIGLGRPVADHVDAAAAAGAPAISVNVDQFDELDATGPEVRAAAAYASERGVSVCVLDGLFSWLPLGSGRLAARSRAMPEVMRLAQALGAAYVNALVPPLGLDDQALAEHFASACDAAAEVGCGVSLEFSPIGGLADLAQALRVLHLAGRRNGGILFDSWHFFRGDPDFSTVAALREGEIVAVQLSDAVAEVQGSLWEDTLHHRRLPGDGVFDLGRVVRALRSTGSLVRVGPEVFSDELHRLGPEEAARVACARVAGLVDACEAPEA